MLKEIKVSAAIVIDDEKILIAKRGYGDFDGMYEFPGGKIEAHESPEETVVRELKEEMNIDIIVDSLYCHIHYVYPSFVLEMDCFKCFLKCGEIELIEHKDYRWINPLEKEIKWVPADVQVIEEIRRKGI